MAAKRGFAEERKTVFPERQRRYESQPYPKCWPPPSDFPVAIDSAGVPVAEYGQMCWNLSKVAKKPIIFNFEPIVLQSKNKIEVACANVDLLKQISLRYILGVGDSYNYPKQLCYDLRSFFILCTKNGIVATDIYKYPAVIDEYINSLKPTTRESRLGLFTRLLHRSNEFGFVLLPFSELNRWSESLPSDPDRQTPYIPPRIWQYQIERLNEFIADFEGCKQGLSDCFKFCLRQHEKHPGAGESVRYKKYGGTFTGVAQYFGIFNLIEKWIGQQRYGYDVRGLCSYLTLAGYIGLAFILNFSLMRVGDAWTLRCNCLQKERDDGLGIIYMIFGDAVKGGGENVCWPTAPAVEKAVKMNETIARLRMICAKKLKIPANKEDYENPYIIVRSYEPWATGNDAELLSPFEVRFQPMTYLEVTKTFKLLFDERKLRVTLDDWNLAAAITPTLDPDKFGPGEIWPLAWHQLRRTGAVNMLSSGIVSEGSLQYLLKHAKRAMSLYYGSGFSKLKLDKKAEALYVRTMFEVLSREFAALVSDRFVSPHGDVRKQQILNLITPETSDKLEDLARKGEIFYRRTLLGGCTRRGGPCPYGGVDNVAKCGGGDGKGPCADVLYDRKRKAQVIELRGVIKTRLEDAEMGSPDEEALKAQLKAVDNALKVINGRAKQDGGGVS